MKKPHGMVMDQDRNAAVNSRNSFKISKVSLVLGALHEGLLWKMCNVCRWQSVRGLVTAMKHGIIIMPFLSSILLECYFANILLLDILGDLVIMRWSCPCL